MHIICRIQICETIASHFDKEEKLFEQGIKCLSLFFIDEVVVYAKLPSGPRGFYIPTPVGKYSPDWAISFKKGAVKHIFFIAETKGTMDSLQLRPIEQAKITCAKKLFNELSTSEVKYHDVDNYQNLLSVIDSL